VQASILLFPFFQARKPIDDSTMGISLAGASWASFTALLLFSLPSLWRLCKAPWLVKSPSIAALYEDEDGIATEESMQRFSSKQQFVVVFFAAAVGIAASFALAVWATVQKDTVPDIAITQLWLLFASWVGDQDLFNLQKYTNQYIVAFNSCAICGYCPGRRLH
jgi:hypothetical protein